MKKQIIIMFSIFSCAVFQASDIFELIQDKNSNALHKALRGKIDLNVRNKEGQTPLIVAVQKGSKSGMALLLKQGVDVNAVGTLGKTALDYAVESKQNHKVRYLVKHGAKVSSQENLKLVQNVLRHRARILMGISLGLLGLVAIDVLVLTMVVPAGLVCYKGCALPLIMSSVVATPIVGTMVPGAYWYHQANKVQML